MDTLRKMILGALVFYAVVSSSLFLYKSYRINKYVNVDISPDKYETYIKTMSENKEKVNKYMSLSKTSKDKICIETIDAYIEKSMGYYNFNGTTKDFVIKIFNDENDSEAMYTHISKNCNISEDLKTILIPMFMSRRRREIYVDNINEYEIRIFDLIGGDINIPYFPSMERRLSLLTEANIIKLVLEEVGERYE